MAFDNSSLFQKIKSFLVNLLLLISGSFLFALSNPGFIFPEGISILAWFSYIPVFILVYRSSFKTVWIYGFVYGVLSYVLYVSWLVIFSPIGSIAINAQYGFMLMLVFVAMKLCYKLFPSKGYLASFLVFCAYEYLKTRGFAGFSYGVTAYTQWKNLILMQCADIAGVWLLSAVIVFVSAWISVVLIETFEKHKADGDFCIVLKHSVYFHRKPAFIWLLCFAFIVVYGCFSRKDYSSLPVVKVAAIQHNTDPWLSNDVESYSEDVENLINLSSQALEQEPQTALVVWPETSFIPPIVRHYQLRRDRSRFNLIKRFLEYVESQDAVFVIGNDHQDDIFNADPEDFNSSLVFVPHKNVIPPEPEIYRKIHLVPFTESFPWPKQFPKLYQALLDGDTHLWSMGNEYTVFHHAGLSFSTPICFEDTFGDSGRNMFRAGSRALVNLTNDAWSKSLSCQNQHLAMARFRCIENRIPAVRSTASGQTCIIDPNGVICAMAEPFVKTFVTGQIPVIPDDAKPTVYCITGDLLGILLTAAAFAVLLFGIIRYNFINKRN